MMSEPTSPPVAQKGLLARFIGVIVSPVPVFEDVVRVPKPAQILLLSALVIALSAAIPQFTEKGRTAALDAQVQAVERFTGKPVTDEIYQTMERRSHYSGYFALGAVFTLSTLMFTMSLEEAAPFETEN